MNRIMHIIKRNSVLFLPAFFLMSRELVIPLYKADWNTSEKTVRLKLLPGELKIFYCGSVESEMNPKKRKELCEKQQMDVEWKVSMKASGEVEFQKEEIWCDLMNVTAVSRYPDFCGTIRYEAELELEKEGWDVMDLGDVYEIARVWVNGKEIGVRIAPPYWFPLKNQMIKGKNSIVIEVTNTLVHQINDRFSCTMPVEPSGMLGPVILWKENKID